MEEVIRAPADFPKTKRLLQRAAFLRVQHQGSAARCSLAVVIVHRRGDDEASRLGIVASRKVGGAVARNRAKRLVREWFRASGIGAGFDVVVIAHGPLARAASEEVADELGRALTRARTRTKGRFGTTT